MVHRIIGIKNYFKSISNTNIYYTISYFNKCLLYLSTNLFMAMLDYNYISILQINYPFKNINVKSNMILSEFYKQNTCSQVIPHLRNQVQIKHFYKIKIKSSHKFRL